MIRSDKKLKELAELLDKNNTERIPGAIGMLRDEQPFEGAIGILTSYYDRTQEIRVRKAIESFLNDLKDQSACAEVISEIRKGWSADTTNMLVSSCWQSGLNYSEFSGDLVELFLKGDYITALECLTVIEESASELSERAKADMLQLVKDNPPFNVHEKETLVLELISILER